MQRLMGDVRNGIDASPGDLTGHSASIVALERYRLTIYFSEIYEVIAEDAQEAQNKADMYLKNFNSIPVLDGYEVECLDEE